MPHLSLRVEAAEQYATSAVSAAAGAAAAAAVDACSSLTNCFTAGAALTIRRYHLLRDFYFYPGFMFSPTACSRRVRASRHKHQTSQPCNFCALSKLRAAGCSADVTVTVTKRHHDFSTRHRR
jgi:hypothetical protein